MEQAAAGNVIKVRSAEMELGVPAFTPSVASAPANVFIQDVAAQSFSADRMSWSFRSPAANLLLSPLAYGVFQIKVRAPYRLNKADQIGPLIGAFNASANAAGMAGQQPNDVGALDAATIVPLEVGVGYRPLLCFGEGNCVAQSAESVSISLNGSTWSCLNQDLYYRSLDRCYVPDRVAQRIYSTCGGAGAAMDDTPISGSCLGLSDLIGYSSQGYAAEIAAVAPAGGAHAARIGAGHMVVARSGGVAGGKLPITRAGFKPLEGLTMDSSLVQRMNNMYDQVVDSGLGASTLTNAAYDEIILQIKFPLDGSVFCSTWGQSNLARSDPRQRQALGIPHANQFTITYQFKDLLKNIIRRLGRPSHFNDATTVLGAKTDCRQTPAARADITVVFDDAFTPQLRMTYIRLPSHRVYPQSAALQVWRREVRRPQGTEAAGDFGSKVFSRGLFDGVRDRRGLRCTGDYRSSSSLQSIRPPNAKDYATQDHVVKEVSWVGVQFPSPPNFIFICLQKDVSITQHDNPFSYGRTVQALHGNAINFNAGQAKAAEITKWDYGAAVGEDVQTTAQFSAAYTDNVTYDGTGAVKSRQELATRYISQNQDSNASILQVEITLQSAVGSWSFRDKKDDSRFLSDRDLLWRKHCANCHADYMPQGRGKWQDRACCALLAFSDICLGLSTSYGTVYPVTFDIRVKFANRNGVASGVCFNTGKVQGKMVLEDYLVGQPVLVGLFHQNILSIASSSAVLSSQAFSQSTTASILASS